MRCRLPVRGLDTLTCLLVSALAVAAPARAADLFTSSFRAYDTGATPIAAAVADFDGDGRADLVVVGWGGNLGVLRNAGDGTFLPRNDLALGGTSMSVALGDVDGDGRLGAAVGLLDASGLTSRISILKGNGDGTFGPRTDYTPVYSPVSTVLADVNGDGRPDLAIANNGRNAGTDFVATVWLNDGTGNFVSRVEYYSLAYPKQVLVVDVTGDGKPDLVVSHSNWNLIALFEGNGAGGFGPRTNVSPAGQYVTYMAAADMNGDGRKDLVMTGSSGDLLVLPGVGGGAFPIATPYVCGLGGVPVIADLDVDGSSM